MGVLASKQSTLLQQDVELAVKHMIDVLITAVANGERIEIRGFGGFSTIPRKAGIQGQEYSGIKKASNVINSRDYRVLQPGGAASTTRRLRIMIKFDFTIVL